MAADIVSEASETTAHYDGAAFMAHRSRTAATMTPTAPQTVALPGALTPITVDRLQAHQEDGLSMTEIVAYENKRFLETTVRVRERHAKWVNREYDAMVKAHQEIEAERRKAEMEAAADYQRRLAWILAERDG